MALVGLCNVPLKTNQVCCLLDPFIWFIEKIKDFVKSIFNWMLRSVHMNPPDTSDRGSVHMNPPDTSDRGSVHMNPPDTSDMELKMLCAAITGNVVDLKALIAAGVDVGYKSSKGYEALTAAVEGGWVGCVKALLIAGASMNRKGVRWPRLIFGLDKEYEHTGCVITLLNWGVEKRCIKIIGELYLTRRMNNLIDNYIRVDDLSLVDLCVQRILKSKSIPKSELKYPRIPKELEMYIEKWESPGMVHFQGVLVDQNQWFDQNQQVTYVFRGY